METPAVVIYSTPTCHFCHMAKDMFSAHNISFTDHNVASDLEKRKEMVDKTGQMGVPVITVTPNGGAEEVIIGFDEERLKTLLNIQ
ncbi:MAG: glutaredoxin family protein [Candidatus Pacebacteria bacterium]|nr:glutaredoxin family protein [Candidatus Paceibacterota bacterium]